MKTTSKVVWGSLLVVLVVASGLGFVRQDRTGERLREELSHQRAKSADLSRLQEENRRLQARSIPPGELDGLRADHAELDRLRAEIEALKTKGAVSKPLSAASPSLDPEYTPASSWKNAGRATASAALETALWSAAGGDIDELEKLLILTPGARSKAESLLGGLPPAARDLYPTAERLIALLTAKDINFDGMRIEPTKEGSYETKLGVLFHTPSGGTKRRQLSFESSPQGWSLVVPENAVDHYESVLRSTAGLDIVRAAK